jgi:hypothetical protein
VSNSPSSTAAAPTPDVSWRTFPALERLLGTPEGNSLLGKLEKTRQDLETLHNTGNAVEKSRAKLAISAYNRTLELIQKARVEMQKQAGESGSR